MWYYTLFKKNGLKVKSWCIITFCIINDVVVILVLVEVYISIFHIPWIIIRMIYILQQQDKQKSNTSWQMVSPSAPQLIYIQGIVSHISLSLITSQFIVSQVVCCTPSDRSGQGNYYQYDQYRCFHYSDVIMSTIASLISSLAVVYPTVYSDADQRKHQSSASLAFVRGIHRDRWIPRTKGQLRGKCFHLMTSSC